MTAVRVAEADWRRALWQSTVWMTAVACAHFALSTENHALHAVHILLAGMFLIPILIGASAFELRGGLLIAFIASLLYLVHLRWNWRHSPMANLDQYAMIGVYFVVGLTAGHLVQLANVRKRERDRVVFKARQAEMVQGLTSLLTALGVRDADTLAHCRRVAGMAVHVGDELGLDGETLGRLRLAALVHDIGKVGVPDDVLLNSGVLSPEQESVMHRHVEQAAMMLFPIAGTEEIARIVRMHHECPDGSGYPRGLIGEQIAPAARVLRVADVFVALTENRPYRSGLPQSDALAQMRQWVGTKIDQDAFEALQRVLQADLGPIGVKGDVVNVPAKRG